MRFEGTAAYVADKDLMVAVNAAIALERPLLVKGEPGTGKTELARQVAAALGLDLIEWNVKSTTRAQQGLYEYDAVSRLRDSQLGDDRFNDITNYIKRGKLWDAFAAEQQGRAADRRDRQGRHRVPQRPAAGTRPHGVLRLRDRRDDPRRGQRPIVIITSNNEKELPDAFLRRCFFHYIRFPDVETLHAHRRGALSRHQAEPGARGADAVLRDPRRAGAQEEAVDLRGARLDPAAGRRRHRAGGSARRPAATRCPSCTARC